MNSNTLRLFTAPDERTAAVMLATAPAAGAVELDFDQLDPENALPAWEALLAGRDMEAVTEAARPHIIALDEESGAAVFEVPQALVERVRNATPADIDQAVVGWVLGCAEAEESLCIPEIAEQALGAIADLARAEAISGQRIYGRLS
ncbi:hypothetical protein [Streptomyces sp. H51]|uniref:hypothetical protein n=1 Tax=Streptomyces sp. H51 TaxID=3111770 RepID=UPI002D779ACB|nr:hypothetical protein [Streptomyces sp. H51]